MGQDYIDARALTPPADAEVLLVWEDSDIPQRYGHILQ